MLLKQRKQRQLSSRVTPDSEASAGENPITKENISVLMSAYDQPPVQTLRIGVKLKHSIGLGRES